MKLQIDYDRLADSVFALAAMKALESGSHAVIGRHESAALRRRFENSLVKVALGLSPFVAALNPEEGTMEIEGGYPFLHRHVENAMLACVENDLGLSRTDLGAMLAGIRLLLNGRPGRIKPVF